MIHYRGASGMVEPSVQETPPSERHSREKTKFRVLGVTVNAVQIPDVIAQMECWISERSACRFIAVTDMHSVTEAHHEPSFKHALNSADMVVPDGMPIVWLGRWQGCLLKRRVYGPELINSFCQETNSKYRHFFYGGAPGVPTLLANTLQEKYGINVVGSYSPPFRMLSNVEDQEVVALINAAKPDVLWVGLGAPKQEYWMYEHRDRLRVPVLIGVGAAFDFNTGRVRQAPRWMREHGLEWLFRLLQEPRRLWRRYLIHGPEFIFNATAELLRVRSF
jgi:N-acetylglucosaminyldiphosphoundecaprenol N-acetyl-beta-D-mannosaminyltransferase